MKYTNDLYYSSGPLHQWDMFRTGSSNWCLPPTLLGFRYCWIECIQIQFTPVHLYQTWTGFSLSPPLFVLQYKSIRKKMLKCRQNYSPNWMFEMRRTESLNQLLISCYIIISGNLWCGGAVMCYMLLCVARPVTVMVPNIKVFKQDKKKHISILQLTLITSSLSLHVLTCFSGQMCFFQFVLKVHKAPNCGSRCWGNIFTERISTSSSLCGACTLLTWGLKQQQQQLHFCYIKKFRIAGMCQLLPTDYGMKPI